MTDKPQGAIERFLANPSLFIPTPTEMHALAAEIEALQQECAEAREALRLWEVAESHPEEFYHQICGLWATCGPGFREVHCNFRHAAQQIKVDSDD